MHKDSQCPYIHSRAKVVMKYDLWCGIDGRHVKLSYHRFAVLQESFSQIAYFDTYCIRVPKQHTSVCEGWM